MKEEILDIVAKKITGIALTKAEELAFGDWLKSDENLDTYNELQKVWQLTGKLSFELEPDVDAEWEKFKMLVSDKKIRKFNKKMVYAITAIAASFILFLGIFGTTHFLKSGNNRYFSNNEVKEIHLPDNTIVYLNTYSELELDRKFGIANRNVYLMGEALFEVKENKEMPFIVTTENGVQAKVLGTSFNLNASNKSSEYYLNVLSGKVLFGKLNTNLSVIVEKGKQASFNTSSNTLSEVIEFNLNAMAWKTKTLEFNNSPINEVVVELSAIIHKKIVIPANSDKIRYSGYFNNPTATEVADVLGLALGWNYTISDNAIEFYSKAADAKQKK